MKAKGSARTQVDIREVRDNVLVLSGNRCRTILSVSSVNFELLSEDEQDAILDAFQSFLNSLTSPIQVLVRVRELDIDRYLEDLHGSRSGETEETYKNQLDAYCGFIRSLVSGNRILSRHFYVVIPYDKAGSDFLLAKEQLAMEQEIVTKGLEKLGMTARQLTSLEILDLFYSFYRPEAAKLQPLTKELIMKTDGLLV